MNYQKPVRLFLFGFGILFLSCTVQKKAVTKKDSAFLNLIDSNFIDAVAQYKVLMKNMPEDRFPKTYDANNNKLEYSNSAWWCSGFYPGTLLYLFEQTKDTPVYREALRMLKPLEKEQFNKNTHDLGFMMFCSFGNAARLYPTHQYNNILINSAKSLSTRFNPKVGCIKSWNSKPGDFIVIIDNMMNLELLFWATRITGDSSYYQMAVTHANTTLKNHYRSDFSAWHVINYDPESGAVKEKRTAQGAADTSTWSRGNAWGLYGWVVMYRETKDRRYLDQANNVANLLLTHPNLPADKIPYWDYNAPNIPNALRDASAASIMASALLELCRYVDVEKSKAYISTAETILKTLSSDQYKAKPGTNGGFILLHGVGHMPAGTEVDVPLTYGDYYFIEAMKRYKEL